MIEPVYKYQIAEKIGINEKTLYRKLKKINLKIPRGLVFPNEQKAIYDALGFSHIWEEIIDKKATKRSLSY